jgi:hypothetical protein
MKGICIEVHNKPNYISAEGDTRLLMYQKAVGGNWRWWLRYFDSKKESLQTVIRAGLNAFKVMNNA